MATNKSEPKLVVIVGPTASGKSDLAMRLANRFNGEIIAADSRTVYKGLDIGTAKPSSRDRLQIKHWGLDLIEPGNSFNAADFKEYAEAKIENIKNRGRQPILVGGSGLYIDSVLFDFQFGPPADEIQRDKLNRLSIEELQNEIITRGIKMPENNLNKRYLIRAIERGEYQPASLPGPRYNALIVGLLPDDETLRNRIDQRAAKFFKSSVVTEAQKALKNYPNVDPAELGIVYTLCSKVLDGEMTVQEAKEKFVKLDWHYAKRQRTWFKRNKYIKWFTDINSAEDYVVQQLNT